MGYMQYCSTECDKLCQTILQQTNLFDQSVRLFFKTTGMTLFVLNIIKSVVNSLKEDGHAVSIIQSFQKFYFREECRAFLQEKK